MLELFVDFCCLCSFHIFYIFVNFIDVYTSAYDDSIWMITVEFHFSLQHTLYSMFYVFDKLKLIMFVEDNLKLKTEKLHEQIVLYLTWLVNWF